MKEERILRAMTEINPQLILAHDPTITAQAPARKGRPFRTVLIAAVVAALFVTVAMAVGLLGGWEAFFGKVPENVTTPVGVSTTSGDYTIALEETIVDEDGAAFLISLRRTDGGVLEGKPELYDMWLSITGSPASMGFHNQKPILSDDGTTVYCCFQFEHDNKDVETLMGRELVISFAGIINDKWTEDENDAVRLETVSLASLAPVIKQSQVNFGIYADMEDPDFVAAMDLLYNSVIPGSLALSKHSEGEFSLAGGVLSQDGKSLALALYQPEGSIRKNNYLIRWADVIALTDTRMGERADIDDAPWGRGDYNVALFELSQPLTLDELTYLEATVEYDTVKYLSDVPFELAFTVTDNGYRKEYTLDRQVDVRFALRSHRYDLHATALQISALGLRLSFDAVESTEKDPAENTTCKLIYNDGTEVLLEGGAGLGGAIEWPEKQPYLTFLPVENVLLDPDRAVALRIGDTHIDLK